MHVPLHKYRMYVSLCIDRTYIPLYKDIVCSRCCLQDDHGYIAREFHRRYRLPSSVDQSAITCTLSTDGLLTLTGPKVTGGSESGRSERSIPVVRDDKPSAVGSS